MQNGSKLQFSRMARLVAQEREGFSENADQVQNLQLLLLMLLMLPPPTTAPQLQRLQQTPCEPSSKSAPKSHSDFPSKNLSPSPQRCHPPHQLPSPLDHLVGGGGDQLPRAALLSWGGTLLGNSWREDRQGGLEVGGGRSWRMDETSRHSWLRGCSCCCCCTMPTTTTISPNKFRCAALFSSTILKYEVKSTAVHCLSDPAFGTQHISLAPNMGALASHVEV